MLLRKSSAARAAYLRLASVAAVTLLATAFVLLAWLPLTFEQRDIVVDRAETWRSTASCVDGFPGAGSAFPLLCSWVAVNETEAASRQCCCLLGKLSASRVEPPELPTRSASASAFTCLPSLVVIGAQKSGTTALLGYLLLHPSILPPVLKELHFFDKARRYFPTDGTSNQPPASPSSDRQLRGQTVMRQPGSALRSSLGMPVPAAGSPTGAAEGHRSVRDVLQAAGMVLPRSGLLQYLGDQPDYLSAWAAQRAETGDSTVTVTSAVAAAAGSGSLPDLRMRRALPAGLLAFAARHITIDVTPSYALGTDTARRIAKALPAARVLFLARNPVERAHSEWMMKARRSEAQASLPNATAVAALATSLLQACSSAAAVRHAVPQVDAVELSSESCFIRHIAASEQLKPIARVPAVAERCASCLVQALVMSRKLNAEAAQSTAADATIAAPAASAHERAARRAAAACISHATVQPGVVFETMPGPELATLRAEAKRIVACSVRVRAPAMSGNPQPVSKDANLMQVIAGQAAQPARQYRSDNAHAGFGLLTRDDAVLLGRWAATVGLRTRPFTANQVARTPFCALLSSKASGRAVAARPGAAVAEAGHTAGTPQALADDPLSALPLALMFDGSERSQDCWPHGSDSNIARDWLYRGLYAQQLARFAAHFPPVSCDAVIAQLPSPRTAGSSHCSLQRICVWCPSQPRVPTCLTRSCLLFLFLRPHRDVHSRNAGAADGAARRRAAPCAC